MLTFLVAGLTGLGTGVLGHVGALASRRITFGLAHADDALLETLRRYGLLERIPADRRFSTVEEALAAYRAELPGGHSRSPSSSAVPTALLADKR